MKKILFSALLMGAAMTFVGCAGEEDNLFDGSAAERLQQAKVEYIDLLTKPSNGWVFLYSPTNDTTQIGSVGYLMTANFRKDMSVTVGASNLFTSNRYDEATSLWDVLLDNGPVLSFNSYNRCLHAFSDPSDVPFTTGTGHDETGTGVGGDYEFIIIGGDEVNGMTLKGKKRGAYSLLFPMEEGYTSASYMDDVDKTFSKFFNAKYPNMAVLKHGDKKLSWYKGYSHVANIFPYNGDSITAEKRPFLMYRTQGSYFIRLRDPYNLDNDVKVQTFKYIEDQDRFVSLDNESVVLEGENPASQLFISAEDKHFWSLPAASAIASPTVTNLLSEVTTGMRASNRSFALLQVRFVNNNFVYSIFFREGRVVKWLDYKLNYTRTENGFRVDGFEGLTELASNELTRTPAIKNLLDNMMGEMQVMKNTSAFDLSTIKVVKADNPDFWFVLNYNK